MTSAAETNAALQLPGGAGSAAAARRFVTEQLRLWGIADPLGDVLILTSELVSNAVIHADGPVTLRLRRTDAGLRLEVADRSGQQPAPRQSGGDGGFGLHIVTELCARWGVDNNETGKIVWCEYAPQDPIART